MKLREIDIKAFDILRETFTEKELSFMFRLTDNEIQILLSNDLSSVSILPNRHLFPWTSKEDMSLQEKLAQGYSVEDLALIHQRSVGAIVSRINKAKSPEEKEVKKITYEDLYVD